ncbi:MAG: hypothetical protein AAFR73_12750 [Pseudomonadota bacterium]
MTLLTIAQELAYNVGLQKPDAVAASGTREHQEILTYANLVGEELARRVDWGALQMDITLTGDGTNKVHDLGAGFSRITSGVGVMSGGRIIRPLTRAEWGVLTPVEGAPRYFLLEGKALTLWPYLANGETVTVSAQMTSWCSNGIDKWSDDSETSLIDETLFLKGLIVRWRRQKGMEFADYEAEFEAALQDFATYDDRNRL